MAWRVLYNFFLDGIPLDGIRLDGVIGVSTMLLATHLHASLLNHPPGFLSCRRGNCGDKRTLSNIDSNIFFLGGRGSDKQK